MLVLLPLPHSRVLCSSAHPTEHERLKREHKTDIINTSIKYSLVTQFTSFVAVEVRERDEASVVELAPSINELVARDTVDQLSYMGWMKVALLKARIMLLLGF